MGRQVSLTVRVPDEVRVWRSPWRFAFRVCLLFASAATQELHLWEPLYEQRAGYKTGKGQGSVRRVVVAKGHLLGANLMLKSWPLLTKGFAARFPVSPCAFLQVQR